MSPTNNNAIAEQVDGRLDDIFGEGSQGDNSTNNVAEADKSQADVPKKKKVRKASPKASPGNSLIENLKSVVLSLEWEINDQIMQKLGEEIDSLKDAYKVDKIVVAFLQLLDSLGKYIQKKKAEAHPESISMLNSVFEELETVIVSENLGEAEKKKMLMTQVTRYKNLKEELKKDTGAKSEAGSISKPTSDRTEKSDTPAYSSEDEAKDVAVSGEASQDIIRALKEINETIKTEIGALREELRSWRESQ